MFAPSCIDHNILMVGGRDDFMRCPDGGAPGPDFPETLVSEPVNAERRYRCHRQISLSALAAMINNGVISLISRLFSHQTKARSQVCRE